MEYEIIKTEYFYEWGFCSAIGEALPTIVVSVAVVLTVKIVINEFQISIEINLSSE